MLETLACVYLGISLVVTLMAISILFFPILIVEKLLDVIAQSFRWVD